MASKFEIYENKSGDFRWRPIHKAKANSMSGTNSVKENQWRLFIKRLPT